jgi:hypothetical protein
MEIPETSVAGGFKEQARHNVVGVIDAVIGEMMRGGEGVETGAHAGSVFEGASFLMKVSEELGESGGVALRSGVSGNARGQGERKEEQRD